jgi:hypothetical protein
MPSTIHTSLDVGSLESGDGRLRDTVIGLIESEKHFQERSAELQIPRLRSPGFPVELVGVDVPYAPFLKRKAHTRPCPVLRGRKSGSG